MYAAAVLLLAVATGAGSPHGQHGGGGDLRTDTRQHLESFLTEKEKKRFWWNDAVALVAPPPPTPKPTPNPTPSAATFKKPLSDVLDPALRAAQTNTIDVKNTEEAILHVVSKNTAVAEEKEHKNFRNVDQKMAEFTTSSQRNYMLSRSIMKYIRHMQKRLKKLTSKMKYQAPRNNKTYEVEVHAWYDPLARSIEGTMESADELTKWIHKRRDYLEEARNDAHNDLAERIGIVGSLNRVKAKSQTAVEDMKYAAGAKYVKGMDAAAKMRIKGVLKMRTSVEHEARTALEQNTKNYVERKGMAGKLLNDMHTHHEHTIGEFQDKADLDDRAMGAEYLMGEEEVETKAVKLEGTLHKTGQQYQKQVAAKYLGITHMGHNVQESGVLLNSKLEAEKGAVDQMAGDFQMGQREFDINTKLLREKVDLGRQVIKQTSEAGSASMLSERAAGGQISALDVIASTGDEMGAVSKDVKNKAAKTFSETERLAGEFKELEDAAKAKWDDVTAKTEHVSQVIVPNLAKQAEDVNNGIGDFAHGIELATAQGNLELNHQIELEKNYSVTNTDKIYALRHEVKEKIAGTLEALPSVEKTAHFRTGSDKAIYDAEQEKLLADIQVEGQARGKRIYLTTKTVQDALDRTGVLANAIVPSIKQYAGQKATDTLNGLQGVESDLKETTLGLVDMAGKAEQQDGAQMLVDAGGIAASIVKDLNAQGVVQATSLNSQRDKQKSQLDRLDNLRKQVIDDAQTTLTHSEKVGKQDKDDHESMERRTAAVAEVARQSVAGHDTQFNDLIETAQHIAAKSISSATLRTSREWTKTKNDILGSVEEKAESIKKQSEDATSDVTDRTRAENALARKRYDDASTAVRGLSDNLRGISANETEWSSRIAEQLSGNTAQAHTNTILNAESALHAQAAIDKKFREIRNTITADVDGLSEEKKRAVAILADEAKRQTEMLVANDAMTSAEKKGRMAKLDAWMQGQLEIITDSNKNAGDELAGDEKSQIDLEKMATSRARELAIELKKADGFDPDTVTRETRSTQGKLLSLIGSISDQTDHFAEGHKRDMDLAALRHEQDASQMASDIEHTSRGAGGTLKQALAKTDQLITESKDRTQENYQEFKDTSSRISSFEAEADHGLTKLTERVGAATSAREHRMGFVDGWQSDFGVNQAHGIYKVADTLYTMLMATDARFKIGSDKINELAQKLAVHMAKDDVQTFKKIKDADETVMSMDQKNDKLEKWAADWEHHTESWESDVLSSFESLADQLAETEGQVEENKNSFNKALTASAGRAKNDIEKKMSGMESAEETEIADAENAVKSGARQMKKQVAEDETGSDAAVAQLDRDIHTAEDRENDKENEANVAENKVNQLRAQQYQAFQKAKEVMDNTQGQYDEARGKLMGKIDEVGTALGEPLQPASVLEMDGTDEDDLRENVHLNVEHRELAKEYRALEKQADAQQMIM